MDSRSQQFRQLAIANGIAPAASIVPSFVQKWRAVQDEAGHYAYAIPL